MTNTSCCPGHKVSTRALGRINVTSQQPQLERLLSEHMISKSQGSNLTIAPRLSLY